MRDGAAGTVVAPADVPRLSPALGAGVGRVSAGAVTEPPARLVVEVAAAMRLSATEYRLLRVLAAWWPQPAPPEALLARVWPGSEIGPSERRMIRTSLCRLRAKLARGGPCRLAMASQRAGRYTAGYRLVWVDGREAA